VRGEETEEPEAKVWGVGALEFDERGTLLGRERDGLVEEGLEGETKIGAEFFGVFPHGRFPGAEGACRTLRRREASRTNVRHPRRWGNMQCGDESAAPVRGSGGGAEAGGEFSVDGGIPASSLGEIKGRRERQGGASGEQARQDKFDGVGGGASASRPVVVVVPGERNLVTSDGGVWKVHHDGIGPAAGDLAFLVDFEAGMCGDGREHARASGGRRARCVWLVGFDTMASSLEREMGGGREHDLNGEAKTT